MFDFLRLMKRVRFFWHARWPRFYGILLAVTLVAWLVRAYGWNYDQSRHFHPDERRIAEAVTQISFHPLQLDPNFFAYGAFPFYVTRAVMGLLGLWDRDFLGYGSAILTGRALSALWGAATVFLAGILGRRLYGEKAGLAAAGGLAVAVLHVQNAHFAVNDVALTFLVLASLDAMVRIVQNGRWTDYAGAGVCVGLSLATKFSAMPLMLPLAFAIGYRAWKDPALARPYLLGVLAGGCVLLAVVAGAPYYFLDFPSFWSSISEQGNMVRNAGALPYTNQYIGTIKYAYPVKELVLWGLGPALGIAALAGVGMRLWFCLRERRWPEAVVWLWFAPYFLITGSFDIKFPRYLLPLYPLLALGAGWLLVAGWESGGRWRRRGVALVVVSSVLYVLAFMAIYSRPHSVVTASRWFFEHVPAGSKVLTQDWDEGFPFHLEGTRPKAYQTKTFGYYEPDSDEKMARLAEELAGSDYVVFQTKRLYGAITQASEKFPRTAAFFYQFFAGDLGYTLIQDVASQPGLFGVELPTELADESFSVYDHPKVLIFQNTGRLRAQEIEAKLSAPDPGKKMSRSQLLMVEAGEKMREAGGMPAGGSAWISVLWVVLFVEALGLALYRAAGTLFPTEVSYALCRVLGLLIWGWLCWILVHVAGMPFHAESLRLGFVLLVVALLCARRAPWPSRTEWMGPAALAWSVFGFFLMIRWYRPEIYWGEKPMDLAFLHVFYRCEHLPPPEPWFAGSYLHYTAWGHYLTAAIGKALGIAPGVMYNLGIALAAGGAASSIFAAGTLVGGSRKTGFISVAVALFFGNLAGVLMGCRLQRIDFDYFWATSRVVRHTVNEYPFWSFVFADLHSHLLVMPFTLLTVALLFLWWQWRKKSDGAPWASSGAARMLLTGLALGAVMATNGWSMPVYWSLTGLVLLMVWWHKVRNVGIAAGALCFLREFVVPLAVIVGSAYAFFFPFWSYFKPTAATWGWEVGPYARMDDFLWIHGFFVLVVVPYLLFLGWRRGIGKGKAKPWQRLILFLTVLLWWGTGVDWPGIWRGELLPAVSCRAFAAMTALVAACGLIDRKIEEKHRGPLLLITLSFAMLAGCEVVYVWDRMNTLFKFYLEAWMLLSLAVAAVLGSEMVLRRGGAMGTAWRMLLGGGAAVALWTSFSGLAGYLTMKRVNGPSWTLDGTAYMRVHAPEEKAAIDWINRTIQGIPVLCEAWGSSYQEFSRISMHTGLPIILGWDYHVTQRGQTSSAVARRKQDIRDIYTSAEEAQVREILDRYHVALVYSGKLEGDNYGSGHRERFGKWPSLNLLYENPEVKIYAVRDHFNGLLPVLTVQEVKGGADAPTVAEAAPPGVLNQPRGIASDKAGNVYVCDFGHHRIQKFGPDLKPIGQVGSEGGRLGQFNQPCGIALGPEGSVYVADTWNGRVQILNQDLVPQRQGPAGFYGNRGIAVDHAGKVYVADSGNNRIMRYLPNGTKDLEFGGPGEESGKFREPTDVAVDLQNLIYVADNGNGRVQIFNPAGSPLRSFEVAGWRSEVFSEPKLAVDRKGFLWVTVPLEKEIRCYTGTGAWVKTVKAEGRWSVPMGFAFSPDQTSFVVTDLDNRLVRVPKP
jgi:YYY domain-containing protein